MKMYHNYEMNILVSLKNNHSKAHVKISIFGIFIYLHLFNYDQFYLIIFIIVFILSNLFL